MPTWHKGLWDVIITLFLSVTFTSTFQSSALKTLGTNGWSTEKFIFFFIGNPPQKQEVSSWCQKEYFLLLLWSAFFIFFFFGEWCFVFIIQTVYWITVEWFRLGWIYYNVEICSVSYCYFSTLNFRSTFIPPIIMYLVKRIWNKNNFGKNIVELLVTRNT